MPEEKGNPESRAFFAGTRGQGHPGTFRGNAGIRYSPASLKTGQWDQPDGGRPALFGVPICLGAQFEVKHAARGLPWWGEMDGTRGASMYLFAKLCLKMDLL